MRRKILEADSSIMTDAILLGYINLAYQDVYKRIYPNSAVTTATITCTAGVCVLPATFGTLYGEAYDTANNGYPEVSIADFDREDFDRAIVVENNTLKVYPLTVTSLEIKHYPKPATLTAVVDPTINDFFHETIVYGATYRCHEDLQDETLTQFYQARFKQELQDRLEAQSVYEETNQRGGSFFIDQSLINDNNHATF